MKLERVLTGTILFSLSPLLVSSYEHGLNRMERRKPRPTPAGIQIGPGGGGQPSDSVAQSSTSAPAETPTSSTVLSTSESQISTPASTSTTSSTSISTQPPSTTAVPTMTNAITTNSNGSVVTVIQTFYNTGSATPISTPSASAAADNSGVGAKSIAGMAVAGGLAVIGIAAFIWWKMSKKRFSDFDDDGHNAIKWPELVDDTAMKPLPSKTDNEGGMQPATLAPYHDDHSTLALSADLSRPPEEHQYLGNSHAPYYDQPQGSETHGGYYDAVSNGSVDYSSQTGRASPGPYAAYDTTGAYPVTRTPSPGPNAAYNPRSTSPGPNAAYNPRSTSPGPNAAYDPRSTSPGPNNAYIPRTTSPGPNNAYIQRSTSPGPNNAYAPRSTSPGPNVAYGYGGGRAPSPGPNMAYRQ